MGTGYYTDEAYLSLTARKSYGSKSRDQIFESRTLDPEMDPRRIQIREARDSADHPNSLPIIVGLDVTGSMGFVPESIVKQTLPDLMGTLISEGIADPQVLFMGIGDFVYDRAPLQVGQFESTAELLDRWLTKVFLEGGGGGNNFESYNLAHLFAARHTVSDHWEKRQKKGYLFTIGDEPCAQGIPSRVINDLTSGHQSRDVSTAEILHEAQQKYHVFHLHLNHDAAAKSPRRKEGWKDLLGDHFIELQDYALVSKMVAELIIACERDNPVQNDFARGFGYTLNR